MPRRQLMLGEMIHTWNASATADGGYSLDVTVNAGDPQRYEAGLTQGDTTFDPDYCDFDPDTDAVVPVHIRVTNTSGGGFTAATPGIHCPCLETRRSGRRRTTPMEA